MASEYLDDHLPMEAQWAGMKLIWHRDRDGNESVTLLDKDYKALHYWPYNANLGEVREISLELIREEKKNDKTR